MNNYSLIRYAVNEMVKTDFIEDENGLAVFFDEHLKPDDFTLSCEGLFIYLDCPKIDFQYKFSSVGLNKINLQKFVNDLNKQFREYLKQCKK